MGWAFLLGACIDARHHGVPEHELRKIVSDCFRDLKDQHDRKIRAQALRERRRWRKADVPRLLQLPGASPAANHRIAGLLKDKHSSGRGVVSAPKQFDQAVVEALTFWQHMVDPVTSRQERREMRKGMPKFPSLIEAAYRGELVRELAKAPRNKNDKTAPHLTASDFARGNVAEAAGISKATVHQLCHQVRRELQQARKKLEDDRQARLMRDPQCITGLCEVLEEPAMTAAELKQYLESDLADLAKLAKRRDLK